MPEIMRGLRSTTEVKDKILPILEKHQISWKDASGKSQKWKYTKCRFEIYAKLSAHGWSLSQIGRLCGDRDHTTVLNGIKRFVKENLTEEEVAVCQAAGMRPVD
jgi:chromosomal replication initiation ATPase DnaA